MLCKKCGKYHPPLEPCYYDLPKRIVVKRTTSQLKRASDKEIATELQRRGILFPPHPDTTSPDYALPVLTSQHLSDPERATWRNTCLELLKETDEEGAASRLAQT